MRSILSVILGLLLTLCAAVGFSLLAEPSLHAADVRPVIYRGREATAMNWLEPLVHQRFLGLSVSGVELHSAEIRISLSAPPSSSSSEIVACTLPGWAHGRGAILLTYRPFESDFGPQAHAARVNHVGAQWTVCGIDPSLVDAAGISMIRQLAERPHGDVWGVSEIPSLNPDGGMLEPIVRRVHIRGGLLIPIWFLLCTIVSVFAAIWGQRGVPNAVSQSEPAKISWTRGISIGLLAVVVIAGAAMRVRAAKLDNGDVDEQWSAPMPHPVLAEDHDSRIHPPAFRAIQQVWSHEIRWTASAGLLALRIPSLVFSVLSLILIALAAVRLKVEAFAIVPLGIVSLASSIASLSIIARPYSLVSLLVVIEGVALWTAVTDRDRTVRILGWIIAVMAAGLCAWTDLVGGCIAGVLLLLGSRAQILKVPARSNWARVGLVGAAAMWSMILVPGALDATRSQLRIPSHLPDASEIASPRTLFEAQLVGTPTRNEIDLRPQNGLGHGSPTRFVEVAVTQGVFGAIEARGGMVMFSILAVLALAALSVFGRVTTGIVPIACVVILTVISVRVAMHPRNILFFSYLCAFAFAVTPAGLRESPQWQRIVKSGREFLQRRQ